MALVYYRNVKTTAKGRWYGKKVSDIAEEFGISARLITDPNHVVKPTDHIEYEVHVHEPPVPALDFDTAIIHESEEFLVLNKPSGIPVHPTVNYYHHSITEMLHHHYQRPFYPCYRLDRLTSGILVLAKQASYVAHFNSLEKHKQYWARVRTESVPLSLQKSGSMRITDPIITFNGKRGYERFLDSVENAKPAESWVHILSTCLSTGLTTLKVEPVTGRTHQIRKHLALHGMPIHNDEVYFDGSRFQRLCANPTPENFASVWNFAERSRIAKLTGESCHECGQLLYHRNIPQLDLHCAVYKFGEHEFAAPAPFEVSTNEATANT